MTPTIAFAQIVITEIMYDPEGADASSGGEWIEVLNSGSAAVDLTQWLFFENETNHSLTADGAVLVPPGGYAVISRDLTAFKNYFVSFSGTLFKASFSLNDGETLAMKSDKDASSSDEVPYTSESGAKNDGNSLQLVGGEWVAAAPTPGDENIVESVSPEEGEPETPASAPTGGGYVPPPPSSPLFTARISEKEKFAVVGAPAKFSAKTIGTTEGLAGKVRFIWNFGDGGTAEGQSIFHTYKYPGEYGVVLDVVSGEHAASDRATLKAIPVELFISSIGTARDFYIEIENKSSYELNLSGWLLKSGTGYFVIPERTFILSKKKLIFPWEITKLSFAAGNTIALLYPNGITAHTFADGQKSAHTPPTREEASERITAPPTAPRKPLPPPQNEATAVIVTAEQSSRERKTELLAATVEPQSASRAPSLVMWLSGVAALILVGGISVIALWHGRTFADEFNITEEK